MIVVEMAMKMYKDVIFDPASEKTLSQWIQPWQIW